MKITKNDVGLILTLGGFALAIFMVIYSWTRHYVYGGWAINVEAIAFFILAIVVLINGTSAKEVEG
ncbi:hypothetical protein MUO71_08250 [Candidatus Bathyarchaeota archaeon]|nr:hypothetical protein [Candidatus Bathyarchaeota archaeon]